MRYFNFSLGLLGLEMKLIKLHLARKKGRLKIAKSMTTDSSCTSI